MNARSRSRIRTDGRSVVLGRIWSSKKRLASSRPTTRRTCHRPVAIAVHIVLYNRPSGHATWTARSLTFTPGVHPTSTSHDVSDQAFPSLSNFYCVLRCACGGRPGNEATTVCSGLRKREVVAGFYTAVAVTTLNSLLSPTTCTCTCRYVCWVG